MDTPTLMAKSGYFDRVPSSLSFKNGAGAATPSSPLAGMVLPNPFGSPTPSPGLGAKEVTKPLQIRKKGKPTTATGDGGGVGTAQVPQQGVQVELLAIQQELKALDLKEEPTSNPSPAGIPESRTTGIIASPPRKTRKPVPSSSPQSLPFRIIKPSLPTLEKATSVALYFEAFYTTLLRPPTSSDNYLLNRSKRQSLLEESFNQLENRFMSEGERQFRRDELVKEENRLLRERRRRVDAKAFEMGRVIGHGAFGVVRIAREKEGGRLVAMKQVSQAGPVGEQDIGRQAVKWLGRSVRSWHMVVRAHAVYFQEPRPSLSDWAIMVSGPGSPDTDRMRDVC